jgi:Tol biopolymer transport system component
MTVAMPLVTVSATVAAAPPVATATPSGSSQAVLPRLVFVAGGLYTINADGSNLTRLTTQFQDRLPSWSPDGKRIVFTSDRDDIGNPDIFVINADGTGLVRLTTGEKRATDDTPFWSPDGQLIAFTSTRDSETLYGDIYVMRPDGTQVRRITTDPTFENIIGWSPDSRQIFYSINHEGAWTIHRVDLDGSHDTVIVDGSPGVLSSDGTAIAFVGPEAKQNTIWVSNVDGTNARQLIDTPATKYSLTWSPDGKRLAFNLALSVANTDGTGQIQLSDPQTSAGEIHWSPDGKYIALQASDANYEVYLAMADVTTGKVTIITPGMQVQAGFAWAPK